MEVKQLSACQVGSVDVKVLLYIVQTSEVIRIILTTISGINWTGY